MPLGLDGKLGILQRSPHDLAATSQEELAQQKGQWVPSRYTVRAATEDGRLVLWNTFSGKISVFTAEQRPSIEMLLRRKGFESVEKGIVSYLKRRGFLIKAGTDEYRHFQLKFGQEHHRQDILQLILLSSEDCNFRCTYCYERFARGTMKPEVRSAVRKLVEKRMPQLRSLRISWFGGEPLYGWEAVEDLAPFFLHQAEKHGLPYTSHMTTNGYLLVPEVADKLLAWKINNFQITIDGPAESHDCSRPARDGSSTFDTILENLQALHRRPDKFKVGLRINFDRTNAPKLIEFLDTVETVFERDPRFQLRLRAVGKWGGPNDDELDTCSQNEEEQIRTELTHAARRRGISLSESLTDVQAFGSQVCYAARPYSFIVGAEGDLMKCTVDLDLNDRNIVGKLLPDGELDLDMDRFAMWTEPAFEKDGQCQKCVVLPSCQGLHCPQIRFDYNRSPCTSLRTHFKEEMRAVAGKAPESSDAGLLNASRNKTPEIETTLQT